MKSPLRLISDSSLRFFSYVGVGIVLGFLFLMVRYQQFLATSVLPKTAAPCVVEFKPGESLSEFVLTLQSQGLTVSSHWFKLMAYLSGERAHLKAGEYEITPGLLPHALLKKLILAQGIEHKITLIEGWNFQQIQQTLDQNPALRHHTAYSSSDLLYRWSNTRGSLEGLLFPDTYEFVKGTSDFEVLRIAYGRMQEKLTQLWQGRASGLPYRDPYQALIAASIIEKEARLPQERALIAGVLVRRLMLHIPLQMDPTVSYGLGKEATDHLTKADLRKETLYNTYLREGLPPTPIAMPSEASIVAALHPALGTALYFVAKGDGSHAFSATLSKHNQAVRKFQRTSA